MKSTRSLKLEELDRIAEDYHLNENVADKFIEDICQHYFCDWLSTLISDKHRIIELGYGEGITVDRLATRAGHYTLVEGSEQLVDLSRQRHPEIEVVHELFEDYVPPEPCDTVLALHVLEHVDDPVTLARHLRSWLKPSGEIVVVVPNRESLHRSLAVIMGVQPFLDSLSARDVLVGHQRVYDLDTLEHDVKAAGFVPFEVKGFFLKTLPNGMMLDYSPELILALNKVMSGIPVRMAANLALRANPIG